MCHVPGVGGRLAWPQLFDAACVDCCQGIPHAPAGDYALGRDLRKRDQHERTFEQTRMRQREVSPVEDEVVIGQEIDIERPVTPGPAQGVDGLVTAAAGRYAGMIDWGAVRHASQQRTGMPVRVAPRPPASLAAER